MMMDVLSDILRSLRFEGTVFFRSDLSPHWGMAFDAANEPRFHIILEGACWLQTVSMDAPVQLQAGDVAVLPNGDEHWMAHHPSSERIPSTHVMAAYERGTSLFQGDEVVTRLLCGLFRFDRGLTHALLSILPSCLHIKSGSSEEQVKLQQTLTLMGQERAVPGPGSDVMVDRLCEILFIQLLRIYQLLESPAHGILAALAEPTVAKALQLMHNQPDYPWTLEKIAREVGISRAVFSDRFSRLVGMPPKLYLTAWRMQKAASLLQDPSMSLFDVAAEVGYLSDTAFRKAFKRFFGVSPSAVQPRPGHDASRLSNA